MRRSWRSHGWTVLTSIAAARNRREVIGAIICVILIAGARSNASAQVLENRERAAPTPYAWYFDVGIRNTGPHERAWWRYVGLAVDQINSAARQNAAMIVDMEPAGAGTFNVIMQRVPGGNPAWWWYAGVDANGVRTALNQNDARPTTGVPDGPPLVDGAVWVLHITVQRVGANDYFGFYGLDGLLKIDSPRGLGLSQQVPFKAALNQTVTIKFAVSPE
jgi:hypothetical protein